MYAMYDTVAALFYNVSHIAVSVLGVGRESK